MSGWKLTYFPVPGAPGEVIRLLLSLSGKEWTDERVPGTKWGPIKPTTKYGQMPILTNADGKSFTQSTAMSRYLAKGIKVDGAPLYPVKDALLAFQIDEFLDAFADARAPLSATFTIQDQAEKEAARAALFATDGSGKIFEALKKIEAQCDSQGYMIGKGLTLADLWAFASIQTWRSGFLDGIPRDGWLDKLPKLKASCEKVAAQPAIQSYFAKQAEGGAKLYAPGKYGSV